MSPPIMLFALCEGIPRDRGRKERGLFVQRGPGSVTKTARESEKRCKQDTAQDMPPRKKSECTGGKLARDPLRARPRRFLP